MIAIERILCPVDHSECSRHAVDHALAMAHHYGATITALHVVPLSMSVSPLAGSQSVPPAVVTAEDIARLRVQTERFVRAESGSDAVDVEVVTGSAVGEIVRAARALPADMIVMGSHGRSGFDRLLLGSVTERVLRKAPCPVMTVPRHAPDVVPAGPILYRRVLCAVDGSPSSVTALDLAMSLADVAGARVTALHVVELGQIFEPTVIAVPDTLDYRESLRVSGRERLRRFLASHTAVDRCVEPLLAEGKADREILRVAAEEQADLIVIGVHGGVAGAIAFGSTATHVVRQATCPVLTIRA